MDWFGLLPGPQPAVVPRSCVALQKAVALMKPLAERYRTGDIADPAALKAERDKEMLISGLSNRAAVRKRPAAAITEEGTYETEVADIQKTHKKPTMHMKAVSAKKQKEALFISMADELDSIDDELAQPEVLRVLYESTKDRSRALAGSLVV